jgi:putative hydrolase of the HAD superfamily
LDIAGMPPAFIYFDLGNVLCHFDRARQIKQAAEVSGVPEEKAHDVLIGSHGVWWQHESSELDQQQVYDAYCRETGSRPEMSAFLRANSDIFTLNSSLLPLVANLEDAQIPLGLLSNISTTHWQFLTDGHLAILPRPFRHCVLSFEVGAAKPDQKIFRRAIELAGVPAGRIFYVDDLAEHVEGAKTTGLDAVQFTTTDALARELMKRGVRCNF